MIAYHVLFQVNKEWLAPGTGLLHIFALSCDSTEFRLFGCCSKPLLARFCISMVQSVQPVLKVLQELPEGLAIAVLAASPADLHQQLDILPASLHHLAIEAAFPSIRRHHSLTLDFDSTVGANFGTACAVLHTATTAVSALRKLDLQHIPVQSNKRLLQLIAAACMSASDVSLSCGSDDANHSSQSQPFAQL
jgi:hypothetical protein